MINFSKKNILSKTILITGSNKGLGFEVAKKLLAKELKKDFENKISNINNSLSNTTYNLILTARNSEKGMKSIDELKVYFNVNNFPINKINFHQLDISDDKSIDRCVEYLKYLKNEKYKNLKSENSNINIYENNTNNNGIIDILLNNAGVAYPGNKINLEIYNQVFSTNVFGTIGFTEKIINEELLNKNSKIIFLSSSLGKISRLSIKIQAEFSDEKLTKEKLYEFSERFKNAIINKTYFEEGWGKHIYALSKIIIKKYAEILAKNINILEKEIQVYSCCPGWVKTDLGGPNASRTLDEGVITILYLIELEHILNKEYQGKFFMDCKVVDV